MWSTKIDNQAPLPTDIVKSVPFATKPTFTRVQTPAVRVKLNTPCAACNEGMPVTTSHIGIVYHNGFGLCKNDAHTMEVNARVEDFLHPKPKPVAPVINIPASAPFPMPSAQTTISVKPF